MTIQVIVHLIQTAAPVTRTALVTTEKQLKVKACHLHLDQEQLAEEQDLQPASNRSIVLDHGSQGNHPIDKVAVFVNKHGHEGL
jgi:hypothetical protein